MADIVLSPGEVLGSDPSGVKLFTAGASGTTLLGDMNTLNLGSAGMVDGKTRITKQAVAGDLSGGIAVIAQAGGASGTQLPWKIVGENVLAAVTLAAEALAIGDPLYIVAGATRSLGKTAAATGVDQKIVAYANEAVASTSARVLVKVKLNGYSGFGASEA